MPNADEREKKKVVVIGGGVGGSILAYTIQSSFEVVLIDQKEYFEIPWSCLRAVVEPSFAERALINHSDYLPKAHIIASAATGITGTQVLTADGHACPYDYLVIATGHQDCAAKTRSERLDHYKAEFEKVKSASSILIVGGGPTGVELAAEIAVDFPEKKVKLVHRGTRLLEFVGPRASEKALEWLTSRKVEVILDQAINLNTFSDGVIQTSSGVIIEADCHFDCTGKPMGSSWLEDTIIGKSLDLRGRVMVDEHMRVRGHQNIFAIGDITDTAEVKLGYPAQRHALVTAKNLKLLSMGANERKLASHKLSQTYAIISLGRRDAVAQLPMGTLCGSIPGRLKSRDLFVGKTRKQLGLKPK
ncbi:hypothetical protein K2173_024100 [Erythroxylum novogranatense]|uniref:FAD/NAD(P)-binding domain-containing protein n=1 Tax=Erythroxylum novogranatense TaxID=1862640 RepID=A0AAV8UBZ1_9ROSI|nr:hypothetical protein K2173_024100 [Erythroxylum novogranatense]